MKKIIIITCAIILIGVIAIAIPFAVKFDKIQFEIQMTDHLASCTEGKTAVAEFENVKVAVSESNAQEISIAMLRTDRQLKLSVPDHEKTAEIVIVFPDGAEFAVFEDPKSEDETAIIVYRYAGKFRTYSITGYKTMDRITKCINPDGYSGKNIILE